MTTTVMPPIRAQARRAKPLWDRIFFGGMAILITGSVVLGFAKTYFFAGVFRAPLPSKMIHIHGAVFSLWFVVLLLQTFLIPAGRVQWHRQIGLASYGVAILVIIFGVLAATDSLRRGVPIDTYNLSVSFAVSTMDMVAFAVVILCSYLARRRPDAHKRLVLFATLSIMDAALDRWPYEKVGLTYAAHTWAYLGLLLLPVIYDLIALHRIHRSTLWSATFVYALNQLRVPIGETHLWTALARTIAGHPVN
jgi:hypothetical protein